MPARPFLFDQSQAGCFHVINRIYDRKFLLDTEGKVGGHWKLNTGTRDWTEAAVAAEKAKRPA